MFDTMTITKVVGGFCGALLVFLLIDWVGEVIYETDPGHHVEEAVQGYLIETNEETPNPEESEEAPFTEIYASADPAAGQRVFNKCKACHKVDGTNATGPHLDGVVGRSVDAVPDFSYSGALEEHFDTWTPENLNAFLTNPKAAAPGTKMTFAGLKDAGDRANVIAYLNSLTQ